MIECKYEIFFLRSNDDNITETLNIVMMFLLAWKLLLLCLNWVLWQVPSSRRTAHTRRNYVDFTNSSWSHSIRLFAQILLICTVWSVFADRCYFRWFALISRIRSDLINLTDLTFSDSSRTWHQVRDVENQGSELGFWNLGFGNLGSWPGLRTWVLNSWVLNLGITPGFWNSGIQNLGELPGLNTWVLKPGFANLGLLTCA